MLISPTSQGHSRKNALSYLTSTIAAIGAAITAIVLTITLLLQVSDRRTKIYLQKFHGKSHFPEESDWTIIAVSNKVVEDLQIVCNGKAIPTVDNSQRVRFSVNLPSLGGLNFFIPAVMEIHDNTLVEVKSGSKTIKRTKFGDISPA